MPSNYRYTLLDIGSVLQHLMGGGFRAYYCRKRFRQKYQALKQTVCSFIHRFMVHSGTVVFHMISVLWTSDSQILTWPFLELTFFLCSLEFVMKRKLITCQQFMYISHGISKKISVFWRCIVFIVANLNICKTFGEDPQFGQLPDFKYIISAILQHNEYKKGVTRSYMVELSLRNIKLFFAI